MPKGRTSVSVLGLTLPDCERFAGVKHIGTAIDARYFGGIGHEGTAVYHTLANDGLRWNPGGYYGKRVLCCTPAP
jgi:hypothetical protein